MERTKQSDAQFFASQRNWSKAQVKNCIGNLDRMQRFVTNEERYTILATIMVLEEMLDDWDENYKVAKSIFIKRNGRHPHEC